MKIEAFLIKILPQALHLPTHYYYRRLRNRLDAEILYLNNLEIKGGRAIDIGANVGIYTFALSRKFDIVEAFEPQPWCTQSIRAYNQVCGNKINIHNVGLSNCKGTLNLHFLLADRDYSSKVSGVGGVITGLATFRKIEGKSKTMEVPVDKLDNYNFTNVSLIKIDVEGHESQVLEGGYQTILREKPVIFIEIEQRHLENKTIDSVFKQIMDLGYAGYFLDGNQKVLTEISKFSYESHQVPFLDDVYNTKYVNNFIFKPVLN